MVSAINPNIFDHANINALKAGVKANDPAAIKATAQQFEALFVQMMLKSMREATPHDGLFDSDQTRLYESLLDQQMALVMSSNKGGIGLAEIVEKQLTRGNPEIEEFTQGLPLTAPPAKAFPLDAARRAYPLATDPTAPVAHGAGRAAPATRSDAAQKVSPDAGGNTPTAAPNQFIREMWPHAVDASAATGIPPHFLIAQAALETGWGRSIPRHANGASSHNLFGIKAGTNWSGATVNAATTEYANGVAQAENANFRAYASPEESFRDYANLVTTNPRYAHVLDARNAAEFARGLQNAGYATDPAYADKLTRLIGQLT